MATKKNTYEAVSTFKGNLMFRVGLTPYTLRTNDKVEFEATHAEFSNIRYPKHHMNITLKSASAPKEMEKKEIIIEKVEEVKEEVIETIEEVVETPVEETPVEEPVEETPEVEEAPVVEEAEVEPEVKPKKTTRRGRKKAVKIETDENE